MDEEILSFDDMSVWMESCALTGAAAFFAGLRGCAVIVNGPLWCYLFTQRHIEQSQSDISHRMKCTQLDNDAIVFGAEAYLREALQPHMEQPPALLAVISGSSASLIGDDVGAIARAAGVACPVVAIDSGGLIGSFADGCARATCAMLEVLLPEAQGEVRHGVNLIGMTSSYYNGENDARELVRLLTGAGYEVHCVFGCDMPPERIGDLAQAELNIVVHDELGLAAAKYIEERCGTPYIAPLPPYRPHTETMPLQRSTRRSAGTSCGSTTSRIRGESCSLIPCSSVRHARRRGGLPRRCGRSGRMCGISRSRRSCEGTLPPYRSRTSSSRRRTRRGHRNSSRQWSVGCSWGAAVSPYLPTRAGCSMSPSPIPSWIACISRISRLWGCAAHGTSRTCSGTEVSFGVRSPSARV